MSCNGCRVLRKGCNNDCILRPCLTWISSPESQANATIFLAKFYGRVGLLNLISAGPDHLRPDLFKSLLHEACGRIINPTYGSVGLIRSGNWKECELAVESVLQGTQIMQVMNTNLNNDIAIIPIESCDIRHLSKETNGEKQDAKIHKKFKRSNGGSLQVASSSISVDKPVKYNIIGKNCDERHGYRAHTNDHLCNESVEDNLSVKNDRAVTLKCGDGQDDDDDESAKALLELTLG